MLAWTKWHHLKKACVLGQGSSPLWIHSYNSHCRVSGGIRLCGCRLEVSVPQPCGTALLFFSGIDFWSSPKGHKAGLGLLDWFSMLTQQARPCLVYKLILYYFQVSYETEPGKSFLQNSWIFSCAVLFLKRLHCELWIRVGTRDNRQERCLGKQIKKAFTLRILQVEVRSYKEVL